MGCELSEWAKSRNPQTARARARVDALPMASNGKGKAVPFPYLDRSTYKEHFTNRQINQAIEDAPIESVSLDRLHAIQHSVQADKVKRYIADPDSVPKGARDPRHQGPVDVPIVVEYEKKVFIHDGHHRTTAAKLMGKKTVKARFVDLDALKVP